MKLNVHDIVGTNAISMQSGENLYNKIFEPLTSGDNVELDFEGVELFASPFFNTSIGLMLKDIEITKLQEKLEFTNLNPVGTQLLNLVISNAIKYYDKESDLAEIVKTINRDPER